MNNQREIYEALIVGETLILDNAFKVKLKNNNLFDPDNNERIRGYQFDSYRNWQIYKKPYWYDNIPDGGVLCWVCVDDNIPVVANIFKKTIGRFPYQGQLEGWEEATPLTKQEIQVFLTNAPDEK